MQLDCMTIGFQEFYAPAVVLSLETRCEDCCQGIFKGEAVGGSLKESCLEIETSIHPPMCVLVSQCVGRCACQGS